MKWDLWLGPAPYRNYNPMYIPLRWRNWLDFGTGILGDHGPHFFDPVVWALDLGFPESIEAETDEEYDPQTNTQTFPRTATVRYQFPAKGDRGAIPLTWYGIETPPLHQAGIQIGRCLMGAVSFSAAKDRSSTVRSTTASPERSSRCGWCRTISISLTNVRRRRCLVLPAIGWSGRMRRRREHSLQGTGSMAAWLRRFACWAMLLFA